MTMGCTSCGGSRSTTSSSGGQSPAARFRSRVGKLPWAHVSLDGTARTPYATQEEADSAARLFGGKAVKNSDD